MKVVHITGIDIRGGGNVAAYRLHVAMRKAGIDSKMFVQHKERTSDNNIIHKSKFDDVIMSKVRGKVEYMLSSKNCDPVYGTFSVPFMGLDMSRNRHVMDADIIYLHCLNDGLMNLKGLEKILALNKKVFWLIHDMWAFTGGCHYSYACKKYISQCNTCQYFINKKVKDKSYHHFRRKEKLISKYSNLSVIAPSIWMKECAEESKIFSGCTIKHIPYTLDLDLYKAIDKASAKAIFDIPEDKKVILFGAGGDAVNNPYKGWQYFDSAMKILANKEEKQNIQVLVFGSDYNEKIANEIPFPIKFTGRLYDEYSLLLAYNSADTFVIPSLADNFPNVILESLACGTPVVGFNVGGIPDTVIHKQTGFLAEYKNAGSLAEGISWVLENNVNNKLGLNARNNIVNNYSNEIIIKKHLNLLNVE